MTRSDDFFTYGMVEVSGVPGMYSACTTDVKNVALIKNVARSWENVEKARENETRILPIPRTSRFLV